MKKRTLREHIEFVRQAFKKRLTFYQSRGLNLSPSTHTLLWQHRRYMVDVSSRAMLALMKHGNESPLIKEWRETSPKNANISRVIQTVLTRQKYATLAQLTYEAQEYGSRESVRRCVAIGIELDLLIKDADQYKLSDAYVNESFDRSILRIRHPDVVEFAQFVASLHNIESLIQEPRFPRVDDHPMATPLTLTEEIAAGEYQDTNKIYNSK